MNFPLGLNLIHWNKYVKSSASESIRNAYFNVEWLSRFSRQPRQELLLWSNFRTVSIQTPNFCINYYKVYCKYFNSESIFALLILVCLELRSACESIEPVLIVWLGLPSNLVWLMKSLASELGLTIQMKPLVASWCICRKIKKRIPGKKLAVLLQPRQNKKACLSCQA